MKLLWLDKCIFVVHTQKDLRGSRGLQDNTIIIHTLILQNTKTILNNEKNRETIEEPAGSNN